MAKNFEELIVWQESRYLAKVIYENFADIKDYNFRNQINSAALSVMNNIAEGFERFSKAEFKRFLLIAKASNAEVRSMIYLAEDFQYLSLENANEIRALCNKLKSGIVNLINSIN